MQVPLNTPFTAEGRIARTQRQGLAGVFVGEAPEQVRAGVPVSTG